MCHNFKLSLSSSYSADAVTDPSNAITNVRKQNSLRFWRIIQMQTFFSRVAFKCLEKSIIPWHLSCSIRWRYSDRIKNSRTAIKWSLWWNCFDNSGNIVLTIVKILWQWEIYHKAISTWWTFEKNKLWFWSNTEKVFADFKNQTVVLMSYGASAIHPALA